MKFGLISVAFWEAILKALGMFWGCLELRFGCLGVAKDLILGVQGSLWGPFWVPFGDPPFGDSLCSKGGLY